MNCPIDHHEQSTDPLLCARSGGFLLAAASAVGAVDLGRRVADETVGLGDEFAKRARLNSACAKLVDNARGGLVHAVQVLPDLPHLRSLARPEAATMVVDHIAED